MSIPFFAAPEIKFFVDRLKNIKYRRGDTKAEADGLRISDKIFAPTNTWAEAVARQLGTYGVLTDNQWQISGSFKRYAWARLYLKALGNKNIYFRVGVDGGGWLTYNIDCYWNALGEADSKRLETALKVRNLQDVRVRPADFPHYDWGRLVTETVTFIQEHEPFYRHLHTLLDSHMEDEKKKKAEKQAAFAARFPNPNIILYGPPGTGKTRHTLELAYEILKGEAPPDYEAAKTLFQKEQGKRLEFVTFHQSFTYEDFVQGIRPDTSEKGELTFKRHDGIFYKIAQRARDEFNQQDQADRPSRVPFGIVLERLTAPFATSNDPIDLPMKQGGTFPLLDADEQYLHIRRGAQGKKVPLLIRNLRALYEKTQTHSDGGIWIYYDYVLAHLEQLAADIKREGPGAHPQSNLLLWDDRQQAGTDEAAPPRTYVLIIDEINRANISKVFGELITLLEKDKRLGGENPLAVTLPSGEGKFTVPANLYLIGTMNTADKSIALLDIALRRRFEFQPLYPLYKLKDDSGAEVAIPHEDVLRRLNAEIVKVKSRDFQIGHAYFLDKDETLPHIFNHKVIPLLYEYFLNDEKKVKKLLEDAVIPVQADADTGLLCYPPDATPGA